MIRQGGSIANVNGKGLESQIHGVLEHRGYVELSAVDKLLLRKQDGVLIRSGNWFCSQISLEENLYDAKWKLDFYVYHPDKFPEGLHIESKWQGSSGSVDEKYVFTVLSLLKLKGDKILVLAGGGARQGAVRWIKSKSTKANRFKFFASFDEFMHWANYNL